ncbi:MAG: Rrf2 family transcriptional regulator [Gemmatimonadaceae bacterium]|nr:Rrf2 family transcriptional regulator [Gemmatimonadaceae bacterium]
MLSQTSEYALRIMAFLAGQPAEVPVPAVAMKGKVRVPANYLSKILNQLTRSGVLISTRGRTGGFRLTRPADRIVLCDVVAPFEPAGTKARCVLGRSRCSNAAPCTAHARWRELSMAREHFLSDTTVEDVASY